MFRAQTHVVRPDIIAEAVTFLHQLDNVRAAHLRTVNCALQMYSSSSSSSSLLFPQVEPNIPYKNSQCHVNNLRTVSKAQQTVREAATICPAPCKLTFDLLTLKVVSESRVTWATSVPILVFLGLFVLDLGPMYATDRQTSDAHHRLMPPTLGAGA